jgi:rod shape-determining protein MreD
MMNRVLMFGGITLGALIQLFLPAWPMFGGIKPPVLAAFALYYALHRSPRGMWIAVFWAALLHDGLDLGGFGPALVGFPIIGVLAHRVRLEIFVDGLVTQMIFGALGAMLVMLITILLYAVTGQRPFHFGYALLRMVGSGLLGMATLPLVALTMNTLESSLPKRRGYGWQ